MKTSTAWVRPAARRKGQDHLAVQAISTHIYADLVPGLTNVTERISYYSFYPWLLWAYEKQHKHLSVEGRVALIRKAECAVTLIAALHSLQDGNADLHVGGLTGRRVLDQAASKLAEGGKARLSQFASLEAGPNRYFMNRLGGFGQYYFGPLRQVGLMGGETNTVPKYTQERGSLLAAALDQHVDGQAFMRLLQEDWIDERKLSKLGAFCPCRLGSNAGEREALLDLLLNREDGDYFDPAGQARRETIALLLDVAGQMHQGPEATAGGLPGRFLDSAYGGALPGSDSWQLSPELDASRRRWAAYRRHELLSVALQALFWAGLAELKDGAGRIPNAEAYGLWFSKSFGRSLGSPLKGSLGDLVQSVSKGLPPLSKTEDPKHDLRLADEMFEAYRSGDRHAAVRSATKLLATLLARDDGGFPYSDLQFPRGYFDFYEVNLLSLRHFGGGAWKGLSVGQWLQWLASKWGVFVHLKVALRKLHQESLETFRIIPHDDALEVVEPPDVGWTNPRLANLTRALIDLGLLDRTHRLTEAGQAVRGELHASK